MTPTAFRTHFPILDSRTFLNSCSQGALSRDVEASLDRFVASWRDLGSPWDLWVAEGERLRERVAWLLGVGADEIAVVPNASIAMGAIATALAYDGERDEVVVSELEFPTSAHAWLAQQRSGASIRWALAGDGRLDGESYAHVVGDRTAVACVTSVSYRTGARADLAAIGAICRRHGALFVVDDYQRTGTGPLDVRALGIDVLVTGALKYLIGASGVAFLYVRRELVETLEPGFTGWFGRANPFDFRADVLDWAATARRFESGTPAVPSLYAAAAGIDLLQAIGLDAIERQIASLASQLLSHVREHGYDMITPPDSAGRGPLVALRSTDADELVRRLAAAGIVTSARGDGVRISFHAYNDQRDLDRLYDALGAEASLIVRV